jgi:hypothetical protein
MVAVNTGRVICSKCGVDCTDLYGIPFSIPENRMRLNHKVQEAADDLDKRYGCHNFCFCVPCSIAAFGILPKKVESIKDDNDGKV